MDKISRIQRVKYRKSRSHVFLKAFIFTLIAVVLVITGYLLGYLANSLFGQLNF